MMRCRMGDEGSWPFGAAQRGKASNRHMLRRLKTVVVSRNAPATNSVILNSLSLSNKLSITATTAPIAVAFASRATMASSTEPACWVDASPQGARKTLARIVYNQDRIQDELLQLRSPLQQREIGAGSKGRASSIIPNSLVPVCVCAGIRPVSLKITMNSAAEASGWAGRVICPAEDRTVAATAYGRSVAVSNATVSTTNSTTGSVIAENVFARLEPSCGYGPPDSSAAVATRKLASDSMNPPPRMSPI